MTETPTVRIPAETAEWIEAQMIDGLRRTSAIVQDQRVSPIAQMVNRHRYDEVLKHLRAIQEARGTAEEFCP